MGTKSSRGNYAWRLACLSILFLCGLSFSGGVLTGGMVPEINNVTYIGAVSIDITREAKDETISLFTINNNTRFFILHLEFQNGGVFVNKQYGTSAIPYELKLSEAGDGVLGKGITPLINFELLPIINNRFDWKTEPQSSATVNYQMKLMASWHKQDLPAGLYQETITATITAVE